MANIKSQIKRNRQNEGRRLRNKRVRTELKTEAKNKHPTYALVVQAEKDTDGKALGTVTFDPAWLTWNGGTVLRITQSIKRGRTYGDLPILADALEEANCGDNRILRHLRELMRHSNDCWVLRLLLALEAK